MPEKTTTNYAFPYPTGVGKVNLGAKDFEELAKKADEVVYERTLNLVEHAASFSAKKGELVKCTAAITITLPAAAANSVVAVLANSFTTEITAGAAKIYGDYIEGISAIKLVGYQHIVLQSDGTNWFTIAGKTGASWGKILEGGAIGAGSGDYTVIKLGAPGSTAYRINFTLARPNANYAVVVSPGPSAGVNRTAVVFSIDSAGFTIELRNAAGEAAVGSDQFCFSVVA